MLLQVPSLILDTKDSKNSLAHAVVKSWHALEFIEMLKDDSRMDWNAVYQGKTFLEEALESNREDVVGALLMIDSVDKSKIPPVFVKSVKENNKLKRKRESSLECSVCTNSYKKDQQVFHCAKGHFVCGDCRPRLPHCAECRGPIIGRAHGFEKFLSNIIVDEEDDDEEDED